MARIGMHGQGSVPTSSSHVCSPFSVPDKTEQGLPTHSPCSTQSQVLLIQDGLTYLQFPGLTLVQGLSHGIFSRLGGISPPPYESLNLGYLTGDGADHVTANLAKVRKVLDGAELHWVHQVHGTEILMLNEHMTWPQDPAVQADALITDTPGIGLLIKLADCQGVILFDPRKRVLANVHCGWRGNVKNILGLVVLRMEEAFGCQSADLRAGISPSLGPCCAEFSDHEILFPHEFSRFRVADNRFDLWALSAWQLTQAGVGPEHIETAGICTRCRTDLFFSYRGEGITGRFGAVAVMRE